MHLILQLLLFLLCNSIAQCLGCSKLSSIVVDQIVQALRLRPSPGFAFQYGVHEYSASGYAGHVEGYHGNQLIHWMGRSEMRCEDVTNKQYEVFSRSDVLAFMTQTCDIPHLSATMTEYRDRTRVRLDLIPRVDLVNNLDYFDKYYTDVDKSIVGLIEDPLVAPERPRSTPRVLSRLLSSPFALDISVSHEHDPSLSQALLTRACNTYVTKFLACVQTSPSPLKDAQRDDNLHRLIFDEAKFSLAGVMGADFAPKALDIAAALVGQGPSGVLYL